MCLSCRAKKRSGAHFENYIPLGKDLLALRASASDAVESAPYGILAHGKPNTSAIWPQTLGRNEFSLQDLI